MTSVDYCVHNVHCKAVSLPHTDDGEIDIPCICTEQESRTLRINDIHELVHQLPESNFEMLDVLIAHLCK